MNSISVTTLLAPLQNGENPYTVMRELLRKELYPSPSGTIIALCAGFSVLLVINIFAGLFCLVARVRRGEGRFYRLAKSNNGTYILPSVILNGLLWSVISSVFALLFIWRVTRTTGMPVNHSLWLNLAFLPVFIGIWIVAIGTVIPALKRPIKPRSSWNSERFFPTSSSNFTLPTAVNLLLFTGILAAAVSSIWIAVVSTVRWNKGIRAFVLFEAALQEIILAGRPRTGGARSVIFTIPEAEEWVSIMFANVYRFESGFTLRFSLAAVAGTMMLIGGTIRLISLTRTLSRIRDAEKASIRASSMIPTLMTSFERNQELIRNIWRIGAMTSVIVLSMGVYCYVCISYKINGQPSAIFLIDRSSSTLLYVTFFFAICQTIATAFALHQTFYQPSRSRPFTPMPTSFVKITPVSLSRSISTSSTFVNSSVGHHLDVSSTTEKSIETLRVEWPKTEKHLTVGSGDINRAGSNASRVSFPTAPAPSYSPRHSIRRIPPPVFSEADL